MAPSVSETAGAREASPVEAIVPCRQPIVASGADCEYSCDRHNVDAYPARFVEFHPDTYTYTSLLLPLTYRADTSGHQVERLGRTTGVG